MKIVEKNIIKQPVQLMRLPGGGTKEESVPDELQGQPVLTDAPKSLNWPATLKEIERHYGCYMDMEYALDTNTNRLWIVPSAARNSLVTRR
ncbi:PEP/pyruvate-binding domain-containing protein [Lactiplantibacillus plantarum]|uniref:PEP/pyruvate-binding domain-containing protein n=1 Tax=Lactiplantibacillus plantarum TaxID=1590 RepID=UPI00358DBBE1